MKIFIDTADLDEIREAHALGVLDGVTTNPSLVARTGRPQRAVLADICEIVKGPGSGAVVVTVSAAQKEALRSWLIGKCSEAAAGAIATLTVRYCSGAVSEKLEVPLLPTDACAT